MIEVTNVRLPLDAGIVGNEDFSVEAVARALGVGRSRIKRMRLTKRSVDARKKADVHFVASFAVELTGDMEESVLERGGRGGVRIVRLSDEVNPFDPFSSERLRASEELRVSESSDGAVDIEGCARPVVVGAGPAGLFCAWELARRGAKPIVIERGDEAGKRMDAIEAFNAGGPLDEESNIQFGEGGAGLFSDGKLTTNIKNPRCRDVLRIFVQAGAPEEILWKAKPHLGTDNLVGIVEVLRRQIVAMGGEVVPRTRFERPVFKRGRLIGIEAKGPEGTRTIATDVCILAFGHSARDTFEALRSVGLLMERKPFAVGVRIEHPQKLVDRAQYGRAAGHPALGAADYKLAVHLPDGRGVYTFCMCPGGEVVCAASEAGGVCVNGMSRYARDGENANAAVLVGVEESDLPGDDVLAGVELQRRMERAAYAAGGCTYAAPAQRVGDFLAGRATQPADGEANPVKPSYARGVAWCDLGDVLPDFVADSIREALPQFDRRLHGFASPDAVMTGVEARSSSPVRVVRDKESLQAFFADGTPCGGVFPCGEGAGYAGGIMSAAVDGLRVAEAVAELMLDGASRGNGSL